MRKLKVRVAYFNSDMCQATVQKITMQKKKNLNHLQVEKRVMG